MSRTDPQFNLRIPEALRDLVMAAAKENKRSATAEILDRLEMSFTKRQRIRHRLDLPMTEPDQDDDEDEEARYPGVNERPEDAAYHVKPISGVSKERLIATTEEDRPLTRKDLNDALTEMLNLFRDTPPGSTTQPKGPASRKRFPKE